jgi:ubiquitin C-terminal hydrolase
VHVVEEVLMQERQKKTFLPSSGFAMTKLVDVLPVIFNRSFALGTQEDAHEFLLKLVDCMHHPQPILASDELTKDGITEGISEQDFFQKLPSQCVPLDQSPRHLFKSMLQTHTQCLECSYSSFVHDSMYDLQLPIPIQQTENATVESALTECFK